MDKFRFNNEKDLPHISPIADNLNEHKLRDLYEHCHELSVLLDYLSAFKIQNNTTHELRNVGQWLKMASGIIDVGYNSAKYDEDISWCRNIYEFEREKSEILADLCKALVTFNFIWGSLEILLDMIDPESDYPKHISQTHRGLYNSACYYLLTRYEPTKCLLFYMELLSGLYDRIRLIPQYNKAMGDFKLKPFQGVSGIALSITKLIRNKFAHGGVELPTNSHEMEYIEVEVIFICSRLMLLTMQMLLIAYLKNENLSIGYNDSGRIDFTYSEEVFCVSIEQVLRTLHLKLPQVDEDQLVLFS